MQRLTRSPYAGPIAVGVIASVILIIESKLPLSEDVHFLLEILWLGVASAALLIFAILPAIKQPVPPPQSEDLSLWEIPELWDEDREWLQTHPDANGTRQG